MLLSALPLLIVIVLAHGGTDLWIIGFFACLLLGMSLFGVNNERFRKKFLKRILLLLVLLTIINFTFTAISRSIVNGITDIFLVFSEVLTLSQTSSVATVTDGAPFASSLLCYGPLAISIALAFVAWLENKTNSRRFNNLFLEIIFIYGIIMLGIGFLGPIYLPAAVLDRYLGFGSILLLSIISAKGFESLLRRGKIGKGFVGIIVIILISSVGFSAVLTPAVNPFNVQTNYSVGFPPESSEITSLQTIVSHCGASAILTDYQTDTHVRYLFLNKFAANIDDDTSTKTDKLETLYGNLAITALGTYGLAASYQYISNFLDKGGLFIYRQEKL